jgi:hypothetical protein
MIFRRLYKRSVTRAFGGFIPEQRVSEILSGLSEWESFKLLLPRAIYRLFFTPVVSEIDALQTVQKMLRDALRDGPDAAGDKRGTPNSRAKPN